MTLRSVLDVPPVLAWRADHVRASTPVTLDCLIPATYPAYARVLNPAFSPTGQVFSWMQLAGSTLTVDASTQWDEIVSSSEYELDALVEPEMGTVATPTAARLARILEPKTTTPAECFFLVWEGYAGLRDDVRHSPTVTVSPDRLMHVLTGSVHDATEPVEDEPGRLPMWWLPADGAWCVGNDIYARSVFVGASIPVIAAIVRDPVLEAYATTGNHLIVPEDF
ncbi:hypothetical protein OL239_10045 [Arthrobacter sp. ATA002]|uniref:hypothetical protein n=1 Tax=Arthrobacter sp. ATA002 TaxID=2991715 RepID=UPI0022A77A9F|nr:hypothetical protein [Arthrobacter sp. ATA002]WAP50419.1 hypothetical protein OL239_10045 [Arthrobacter sp. ATA002]